MRKRDPMWSAAELADMANYDRTTDIIENKTHGVGGGYSKVIGGVKNGTTTRPTKVKVNPRAAATCH